MTAMTEGQVLLGAEELHVLSASLLAVCALFSSEEDFYVKVGFFRENAQALANGLVDAIQRME